MEILYARSVIPASEGRKQLNPRFFDQPVQGATLVVIDGDYPEIEAAYRELNVPVELLSDAKFTPPAEVKAPERQAQPVDIPENWRSFGFQDLRRFASGVSERVPANRKQAEEIIEAALGISLSE